MIMMLVCLQSVREGREGGLLKYMICNCNNNRDKGNLSQFLFISVDGQDTSMSGSLSPMDTSQMDSDRVQVRSHKRGKGSLKFRTRWCMVKVVILE